MPEEKPAMSCELPCWVVTGGASAESQLDQYRSGRAGWGAGCSKVQSTSVSTALLPRLPYPDRHSYHCPQYFICELLRCPSLPAENYVFQTKAIYRLFWGAECGVRHTEGESSNRAGRAGGCWASDPALPAPLLPNLPKFPLTCRHRPTDHTTR